MNVYTALILAALLLDYLLNALADVLNLRALQPQAPAGFDKVYDVERYRKSQEYTRARTQFGLIPATFNLLVLLVFWAQGGFLWFDSWVRGFECGPVVSGLIFIGILAVARTLLNLPFSWYSTFVIEERFGFNKTTPKTFIVDLLKGLFLTVLLGGALLAALLWFFETTGGAAWIWCWAITTLFTIVLQFVAPTWIMPLFNKFKPLEEGELREAVMAYSKKVAFPLEGLFVIDGSRRSTKANAFFTGFGKHKRVALLPTP